MHARVAPASVRELETGEGGEGGGGVAVSTGGVSIVICSAPTQRHNNTHHHRMIAPHNTKHHSRWNVLTLQLILYLTPTNPMQANTTLPLRLSTLRFLKKLSLPNNDVNENL